MLVLPIFIVMVLPALDHQPRKRALHRGHRSLVRRHQLLLLLALVLRVLVSPALLAAFPVRLASGVVVITPRTACVPPELFISRGFGDEVFDPNALLLSLVADIAVEGRAEAPWDSRGVQRAEDLSPGAVEIGSAGLGGDEA